MKLALDNAKANDTINIYFWTYSWCFKYCLTVSVDGLTIQSYLDDVTLDGKSSSQILSLDGKDLTIKDIKFINEASGVGGAISVSGEYCNIWIVLL